MIIDENGKAIIRALYWGVPDLSPRDIARALRVEHDVVKQILDRPLEFTRPS